MCKVEYNKLKSLLQTVQCELDDARDKLKINKNILFQNSKMAVMGEMIDAIAHQWIQPLNIISMRSEFLTIYANDDGFVDKKYLEESQNIIAKQINHLITTLSEFRYFLRPNYNIKQVNLKSILKSISILLKDELLKNNTVLNVKNSEDVLIWINENDIKHIFINLINNAKDEMINSDVGIDNRVVSIAYCINNENKIEILVKDNGNGIPKEIMKDIFKPNFTTKKDKGGTGIGLYLCRQLITKYNGKVDVYNNCGAVFRIIFNIEEKR